VLRLHLAVDSRGHRPQGPDALPEGVDAAVVLPLEGLRVGLLEEEEFSGREREREFLRKFRGRGSEVEGEKSNAIASSSFQRRFSSLSLYLSIYLSLSFSLFSNETDLLLRARGSAEERRSTATVHSKEGGEWG
jgi:hypothetical protein